MINPGDCETDFMLELIASTSIKDRVNSSAKSVHFAAVVAFKMLPVGHHTLMYQLCKLKVVGKCVYCNSH